MTYLYEELNAPTRLYIKQCSHCNLKYFGKSIKEDLEAYEGSGIHWQRHLKKHSAKALHLWNSDWYYDTSITRFALKFSNINKIVESNLWANSRNENGLDGGPSGFSEKSIQKMSDIQNNPEWKETIGKRKIEKFLSIVLDEDWRKEYEDRTYKTCIHCGWYGDPGNYALFHGDNCKEVNKEKFNQIARSLTASMNKTKICEHCNKEVSLGNYGNWHGDKCSIIKERNKVICPHCNKTGRVGVGMYRWHFDNCKHRK